MNKNAMVTKFVFVRASAVFCLFVTEAIDLKRKISSVIWKGKGRARGGGEGEREGEEGKEKEGRKTEGRTKLF